MLAWLEQIPQIIWYFTLILLPGGIGALLLGARGWQAVAYALPLSFFITGISGILADKLGISYGLRAFLLATVLFYLGCGVVVAVGKGLRLLRVAGQKSPKNVSAQTTPENLDSQRIYVASGDNVAQASQSGSLADGSVSVFRKLGDFFAWSKNRQDYFGLSLVALVGVTFAWRMILAFQQVDWFSQSYDNVFHLNMIERIVETGQGSLLHGLIYDATAKGFYPLVFHDLVSLLVPYNGGSVTTGVNAFLIALVAFAWPLMIYASARLFAPNNHAVAYVGTIFAFALPAFPAHLLYYGVLYPNLLGFSTIIPLTAVIISYLEKTRAFSLPAALAFSCAGLGACFAHPNVLFIMAYIGVAPLLWYLWSYIAQDRSKLKAGAIYAGILLGLLTAVLALLSVPKIRHIPAKMFHWTPDKNFIDALGTALVSADIKLIDESTAYFVAVVGAGIFVWICALGLFMAKKYRWLVISHLILVALVVISRTGPEGTIRSLLVGWLYADARRIGSTLGITGLMIIALGLPVILKVMFNGMTRKRIVKIPACVGALGLILAGIVVQFNPAIRYSFADIAETYQVRANTYITAAELKLMQRVSKTVPVEEKIIASPWQGGALVWTLGHRQVLYPHFERLNIGEKANIPQLLLDPNQRAKACNLLRSEKAYWVLDFKQGILWGIAENDLPYQVIQDFPEKGLGKVVDSEGESARLVRITACDK